MTSIILRVDDFREQSLFYALCCDLGIMSDCIPRIAEISIQGGLLNAWDERGKSILQEVKRRKKY